MSKLRFQAWKALRLCIVLFKRHTYSAGELRPSLLACEGVSAVVSGKSDVAKTEFVRLATDVFGDLAFYRIDGQAAGLALWQLFGTTNQVLGGLTLLAVTVWLIQRGRNYLVTLIPMVGLLATTLIAMLQKVRDFVRADQWLLVSLGSILILITIWLVVEAWLRLRVLRKEKHA
jgi:carbon starvation protein CstA